MDPQLIPTRKGNLGNDRIKQAAKIYRNVTVLMDLYL